MEISFSTQSWKSKIEKGKYFKNNELDLKLQTRMKELESAETLYDIFTLPHLRLHKLLGKERMYQLAVDIAGKINPNRIVFRCLNGEDLACDWSNPTKMKHITQILILQIGDYH